MRRRLYFLLPNVEHCKQLIAELNQADITEHNIHAIAKEGITLEGINEASSFQTTELNYGLGLGITSGGIAGFLGGLLVITFPPAGLAIIGEKTLILATTVAGILSGSLVSFLVARDIPNHELRDFQLAIERGQILLLIDIPTHRVEDITQLIKTTHPEAEIGVTKPSGKSNLSKLQKQYQ